MFIQHHWNKIVERDQNKEFQPRDYIRGSELGQSFVDRWLKMKGEKPTNYFQDRVLRIFDGGKATEYVVIRALAYAGILNLTQKTIRIPATETTLEVVGHLDATIGGFVNWEEALQKTQEHIKQFYVGDEGEEMPVGLVEQKALSIINGLRSEYPDGNIPEFLVEIKSVNSMAFWAHKNKNPEGRFLGYPHNKLQLYSYMKATGIERGLLLYISRDDYTMEEIGLMLGDPELEQMLQEDLTIMTTYFNSPQMPPVEEEIVYNDRKKTFELNWKVQRSIYLKRAYGYETQEEMEETHHQRLLDINRALKHLREDKIKPEDHAVIAEWRLEEYK